MVRVVIFVRFDTGSVAGLGELGVVMIFVIHLGERERGNGGRAEGEEEEVLEGKKKKQRKKRIKKDISDL